MGSIDASLFLLWWHYLALCKMYVFLCAETLQVLTTAFQGLRRIFYSSPNPSLTSHWSQTLGSPAGPGWGKQPGHHPTPIPVSPKKTAKALGPRLGSGQVPKTRYSCVLLILQSRPGPLQGLWAPTSTTAVGWGTGVLWNREQPCFFPARGGENWKKSQGKDNWGSGKCGWCQENTAWRC